MKWLEKSNIFTSTLFFSAQSSFIQKFKLDFCDNICRVHTVWWKSKNWEVQNFLRRKSSVSLKKDFIFQVHWYFSTSNAFYLQVSYIYANHRHFRPIHFSSYGNLKVILEATFEHLSFSSLILTSSNIWIQGLLAVNFTVLLLKLISYYEQ